MQYTEKIQDLFATGDDYYLAHCISADFGMGAGIVIQFNKRFNMKKKLQQNYLGYLDFYRNLDTPGDCILEGRVFNLITKERYYQKPTLESMENALIVMRDICLEYGIKKIAMPTIGAGLDKLRWPDVVKLIYKVFEDTDIEILVCKLRDKTLERDMPERE